MAYISQEKKAKIAPVVKEILKRYGVKGTLSIYNHSDLTLTLKSGSLDFVTNYNETIQNKPHVIPDWWEPLSHNDYISINHYHYKSDFSDIVKNFITEIVTAMNDGNHDNSDISTDYFDVGWYISIHVGKWNKPYVYEKKD